jgi:hypothetical protein
MKAADSARLGISRVSGALRILRPRYTRQRAGSELDGDRVRVNLESDQLLLPITYVRAGTASA